VSGKVTLSDRRIVGNDFTHTITTWVSAPPAAAFDYIADIRRHAEWATNPMTVEALDGMA
jgi:hypothetical protein